MNLRNDKTPLARTVSLKIYKIKDFIRLTENGEIDIDRSKHIVHQLAVASSFYVNHNILLDMRDTNIQDPSMESLVEVALEFGRYKSSFKGKLANVVPNEETRIRTAKQLKALMNSQDFRYEIFTSFEDAVEWLSDVKVLP
jgi:hypothetical protein